MKAATLFCLATVLAATAHAAEMRRFQPIRSPVRALTAEQGAEPVAKIRPVAREKVDEAIKQLAAKWNTPEATEMLSEDFFDKSRLADSMADATKVPRDAKVRLVAVQGAQTLQQATRSDPDGARVLVSVVRVTATTQVEFNDPDEGFVRLEGANSYLLEIKEKLE